MDYIIRATAANERIRAFAATTRDLVEQARAIHNTSPVATAALGRLLTGAAMMGITMKGAADIMTIMVKGDGPIGGITVTTDSRGHVKGYVNNPNVLIHANAQGKLDVGGAVGKGTLTVIRDLGLKEPYVGSVQLATGEIGDDLTLYYSTSEQTPASVGLGVLLSRDNVVEQAGGFMIQLMPDTPDEVIDQLEANISGVKSVTNLLKDGLTPEDILHQLLAGLDVEILDRCEPALSCNCSRDRMARALISLGKKELNSLIEEGEPVELVCQFCKSAYTFTVDDLKEMLAVL